MIIALVGQAQSGKDTTGNYLINNYNFQRISFAEPLKKIAYDIDPLIDSKGTHIREAVDEHGWDFVKTNYPEARRFLQRLGTEGLRENINDDFWVNMAINKMTDPGQNYVITDMRFINEREKVAAFAKSVGQDYYVWRIVRDGLASMNHASETELARISTTHSLENNASIEDLHATIASTFARLKPKAPKLSCWE